MSGDDELDLGCQAVERRQKRRLPLWMEVQLGFVDEHDAGLYLIDDEPTGERDQLDFTRAGLIDRTDPLS